MVESPWCSGNAEGLGSIPTSTLPTVISVPVSLSFSSCLNSVKCKKCIRNKFWMLNCIHFSLPVISKTTMIWSLWSCTSWPWSVLRRKRRWKSSLSPVLITLSNWTKVRLYNGKVFTSCMHHLIILQKLFQKMCDNCFCLSISMNVFDFNVLISWLCLSFITVEVQEEGMSGVQLFFTIVFSIIGIFVLGVVAVVMYGRWKENSRKRFYWEERGIVCQHPTWLPI